MFEPMTRAELEARIASELPHCTPDDRALYARAAIAPAKWQLSPWGDAGGGFWVIAVHEDRVLWYNDVEDGFNVSCFSRRGDVGEYWCNQDELRHALPRLAGELGVRLGPPQPLPEW
ncbi:MAG TPA: hypothetical protein VFK13_08635 [Gemmatimonadaceae bacterium]|jgi:hypothetical protein|nr:hypothetical protein [Gemmatimonadaceae bacterium]